MIYQNCNCVVYVCIFNIIYIVANVRYERLYNIYYSHSYLNHTKKKSLLVSWPRWVSSWSFPSNQFLKFLFWLTASGFQYKSNNCFMLKVRITKIFSIKINLITFLPSPNTIGDRLLFYQTISFKYFFFRYSKDKCF